MGWDFWRFLFGPPSRHQPVHHGGIYQHCKLTHDEQEIQHRKQYTTMETLPFGASTMETPMNLAYRNNNNNLVDR